MCPPFGLFCTNFCFLLTFIHICNLIQCCWIIKFLLLCSKLDSQLEKVSVDQVNGVQHGSLSQRKSTSWMRRGWRWLSVDMVCSWEVWTWWGGKYLRIPCFSKKSWLQRMCSSCALMLYASTGHTCRELLKIVQSSLLSWTWSLSCQWCMQRPTLGNVR